MLVIMKNYIVSDQGSHQTENIDDTAILYGTTQ
jgi:hypothetical protein